MMLFLLLIVEGLLMLTIFVLGVITIYFMFNCKFMINSPPIPSSGKVKRVMLNEVADLLKQRKNQVVMDLGSGWGSLLIPLAKQFPKHKFIGIEYGCIPFWASRWRARKLPNMTFYRQNFFDADISKADIIFLFLLKHNMNELKAKLEAETKRGTLIYANRFPMKNVVPNRTIDLGSKYDTYFIYEMPLKNKKG